MESALQASCATALLGLDGDGQSVGLLLCQVFKKSRIQIDSVLIQKKNPLNLLIICSVRVPLIAQAIGLFVTGKSAPVLLSGCIF